MAGGDDIRWAMQRPLGRGNNPEPTQLVPNPGFSAAYGRNAQPAVPPAAPEAEQRESHHTAHTR